MKKKSQRPVFQAVFKYRYPVMAIASGLHRISGVILFLLIPLFLWILDKSLVSADGFQEIKNFLGHPFPVTVLWIMIAALIYHLFAGIRHLMMDAGYGDSLKGGKVSAYSVMILTIIMLFFIGILV